MSLLYSQNFGQRNWLTARASLTDRSAAVTGRTTAAPFPNWLRSAAEKLAPTCAIWAGCDTPAVLRGAETTTRAKTEAPTSSITFKENDRMSIFLFFIRFLSLSTFICVNQRLHTHFESSITLLFLRELRALR